VIDVIREQHSLIEELDRKYDLMFPEKIIRDALSSSLFRNPVVVSSFGASCKLHMGGVLGFLQIWYA